MSCDTKRPPLAVVAGTLLAALAFAAPPPALAGDPSGDAPPPPAPAVAEMQAHPGVPGEQHVTVKPFKLQPAGEDHLILHATDLIEVPGVGEDRIELFGTYTIQRGDPTSMDWNTAVFTVEMVSLKLRGYSPLFGEVLVTLNPTSPTHGIVGPAVAEGDDEGAQRLASVMRDPTVDRRAKIARLVGGSQQMPEGMRRHPAPCLFDAYIRLELPEQQLTLVNREPIRLHHLITHVPPIGQGGGTPGEQVSIPLVDLRDPDGPPVAYLKQVRTVIGPFVED